MLRYIHLLLQSREARLDHVFLLSA